MTWHHKVNKGQLLMYRNRPSPIEYDGTDTEQLFHLNLQRQPADWQYRSHPIRYQHNRNGYRAPEWAKVDWQASHIIMGCSYVAGIGVSLQQTVSSQLAQRLNQPVINLGYSGGGPTVVQYNTLMLACAGIQPLSVSIVAPSINRYTLFDKWNAQHLFPSDLFAAKESYSKTFYTQYVHSAINSTAHARLALETAEAMWTRAGVPVHMYDFNLDIGDYAHLPITDFGRDLVPAPQTAWQKFRKEPVMWTGHAGAGTYKQWAEIMFDKIRG